MFRNKILLTALLIVLSASSAMAFKPIDLGDGHYLKFFYDAQFGYTGRNTGSGDEGEDSTNEFNFRRNRVGFIGTYNEKLSFYVQTEYIEDKNISPLYVDVSDDDDKNFYLLDAQIRYKVNGNLDVVLGKFKHSLTRENLEGCFNPLTLDRSHFVYAPFKTSRDKGIGVRYEVAEGLLQFRGEIQEGRTGDEGNGSPDPGSNLRYTGRVHLSLLDKERGYGYKGTYFGKKKILTVGGSAQYEADAVYGDTVDKTDKKDYVAYSADIFAEYPTDLGTFTASAAYLEIDFDDAYKGANPDSNSYGLNGERKGQYFKAAYMLPKPVGPGLVQIFGRYDNFEFANLNGFYDNEVDFYAGGINYYLNEDKLKITAQYSQVTFEDERGTDTNMQDFSTFELYLQVRF
ncbi:selenite/tellurite reduction operon porin ExtI [Deferribacteres bacterium DY0037]